MNCCDSSTKISFTVVDEKILGNLVEIRFSGIPLKGSRKTMSTFHTILGNSVPMSSTEFFLSHVMNQQTVH